MPRLDSQEELDGMVSAQARYRSNAYITPATETSQPNRIRSKEAATRSMDSA